MGADGTLARPRQLGYSTPPGPSLISEHFRLPSKYDKPFYFGEGSPTQRIFNVELQRLALC